MIDVLLSLMICAGVLGGALFVARSGPSKSVITMRNRFQPAEPPDAGARQIERPVDLYVWSTLDDLQLERLLRDAVK